MRAAYERALAYAGPLQAEPRRPEPEARVVETEIVAADPEPQPQEPPIDKTAAPEDTTRWELPDPDRPKRSPADRAWRLASDSPEQPGGRRAKQWRPADTPRPVSVFDAATEQDFMVRRQTLMQLLAPPVANAKRLQDALRAFLASPVLEQVERYNDAERWIAGLIAGEAPRSDALIDVAIEHFRWDEGRVGPRSLVGARVLARREDLRFLATIDGVGSPYQGARAALSKSPSRWRAVANRLTPDLGRKVGAFLVVIRGQRPGLAGSLNAAAVAWWDRHLAKPRLGPIAIWALVVAALIPMLALVGRDGRAAVDLGPALVPLAAVAGIVLIRLYGVAWPRRLWRQRWVRTAPAWVEIGWAPAALAPLALAALIPASVFATVALAGFALAVMFWATAVGEPDTRQIGQPIPPFRWRGPIITFPIAATVYLLFWGLLRPGVRLPWRTRSLFAFTYLAIFWLIAGDRLPASVAGQMTIPLIAAAVAFVAGAGTLGAAWQDLPRRTQDGAWAGLAALALCAVAALWLARTMTASAPFAAALICMAVLLHKTLAMQLQGFAAMLCGVVMRVGGLLVIWLVGDAVDAPPVLGLLAPMAFGVMLVAAERSTDRTATGRRRLGQAASTLARFGWIAAVPLIALQGLGRGATPMLLAGLWMLTGVGVTLAALAPSPPPLPWGRKMAR